MTTSRRSELLAGVLLVILTAIAFWPALSCEFVNYDDGMYVVNNQHLQSGLSPREIGWAFTTGYAANWHPLTWLSLMLDEQLWGNGPRGYHATNVAIHVVNVVLLFMLLKQMTGATWRSALVAALFAVHPLRAESVAWVSERKDVLSAGFGFAAILVYAHWVRSPSRGRYALLTFLYACSLMSKPTLVTLPCLLLLLDFWPLGRLQALGSWGTTPPGTIAAAGLVPLAPRTIGQLLYEKIPLFVLALASSVVTYLVQAHGEAVISADALSSSARLANALVSYVRYMEKFFDLNSLACFYPYTHDWPSQYVIGSGAILLSATALFCLLRRGRPWLLVGWFWYLGLLVPVIGLVQVGAQSMADRYSYLPTIGLMLLAVWSIPQRLFDSRVGQVALGLATALCLGVLCFFTQRQVGYWHDDLALSKHALAVTENNFMGHCIFGAALAKEGRFREALQHFEAARVSSPSNWQIFSNRGEAFQQLGDLTRAAEDFAREIELRPNHSGGYCRLGAVYEAQGRHQLAIDSFTQSLERDATYAPALSSRAASKAKLGKFDAALADVERAIELKPKFTEAYVNRGNIRRAMRQPELALKDYQHAVRIDPKSVDAFLALGSMYQSMKDDSRAIEAFSEAIALKPRDPRGYSYRAIVYYRNQQYDRALDDVRKCEKYDGHPPADFIKALKKATGDG